MLVGAECEESLPLRYLQASLDAAGFGVTILSFNDESDMEPVAAALAESDAPLAGFSMVFTARATQFARLARRARELGYSGHIVAGGHFAAFNAESLLRDEPSIDSVAIGEGERLIVDLAARLDSPGTVSGLVWRDADGAVIRNPVTGPAGDLDVLSPPVRMTPPDTYLGLPIANMLSSRGCTHACFFCSIAAWHRLCGGACWRARSVESVAAEMANLYARGYRLFNFHDDNFLPGDTSQNLERVSSFHAALTTRRVNPIGFAIKSRPDAVETGVFRLLKEMGLFRVFLGIEAGTAESLRNLGRRQTVAQNTRALDLLNELDLHVCYNLLLFNPDSTLEDVRANVAFMADHPVNPMNFCRTEVYSGTPLEAKLRRAGRLEGSYWGYGYHIRDPRAQLAFELMHRWMFDRHHSDENIHHLTMRVDYECQLLTDFFSCPEPLRRRSKAFVRDVNLSSAGFLMRLIDMADCGTEPDAGTLAAFRSDLARDTGWRTKEACAILGEIRRIATRHQRAECQPFARLGVAASLLLAAGTSAMGQHMSERVAVPLNQPVPPAAPRPSADASVPAKTQPVQPPDGDATRIQPYVRPLAQIIAQHVEEPADVDVELWLGDRGEITFAAVYRAGKGKDAVRGALTKEDKAKAEKLLAQLGATKFTEREKATRDLQALGSSVVTVIKEYRGLQTDPEVIQRCDQIIKAIDIIAPVKEYDDLVKQIQSLPLRMDPEGYNRRYLITVPSAYIERYMRRALRPGMHIYEMAPAARD